MDHRALTLDDRAEWSRLNELEAVVSGWTTARTIAEVSGALDRAGIPFGVVDDVAGAAASAQVSAREMLVEIDHPTLGPLVVTGIPAKLSATPGSVRKAPPTAGEDNDFVYGTILGLEPAEIAELRASGAI